MSGGIAGKWTTFTLLKFAFPTTVMVLFASFYTMVDGIFVAKLISEEALSAVNIIFPLMNFVYAVGLMFSIGGSAIIAKKMGEGKRREAQENLSLIYIVGGLVGIVILVLSFCFDDGLLALMGSTEKLSHYTRDYMLALSLFWPMGVLQVFTEIFLVTAGKPGIGLGVTVVSGVANVVFDYIFIVPCGLGIAGAALGTGLSYTISAVFGIVYFAVKRKGILHFVRPKWDGEMLLKCMGNGASEMVNNLALSVTTLMFNMVMLQMVGESGVAAIAVIVYLQYFQQAIYMGYSSGVAPVFSFNYGEKNKKQIHKIFKISIGTIGVSSILVVVLSFLFVDVAVKGFIDPASAAYGMTRHGFLVVALSYLLMGFNIFASSLFTAFSNGRISAILSSLRSFFFIVVAILVLPRLLGIDGVWLSIPLAEFFTFFVTVYYFVAYRKVYYYGGDAF